MKTLVQKILTAVFFAAFAGSAFGQYFSPMQEAIIKGNKAAVRYMLETGYKVNTVEEITSSAPRKIRTLLTPLQMALHYRQVDLAEMLIEDYGANINLLTSQTALHEALWGDLSLVQYLLSKGAEPNHKNNFGDTPLNIICSSREWPQALELMYRYGANMNVSGFGQMTPLHNAAYMGYVGNIQTLLNLNANINAKDKNGNTPLHLAVKNGNIAAAKILIEAGAKTNIKNDDGFTVVKLAENGNVYQSLTIKALIQQAKEKQDAQRLKELSDMIKFSDKKEVKGI